MFSLEEESVLVCVLAVPEMTVLEAFVHHLELLVPLSTWVDKDELN